MFVISHPPYPHPSSSSSSRRSGVRVLFSDAELAVLRGLRFRVGYVRISTLIWFDDWSWWWLMNWWLMISPLLDCFDWWTFADSNGSAIASAKWTHLHRLRRKVNRHVWSLRVFFVRHHESFHSCDDVPAVAWSRRDSCWYAWFDFLWLCSLSLSLLPTGVFNRNRTGTTARIAVFDGTFDESHSDCNWFNVVMLSTHIKRTQTIPCCTARLLR